MQVTTNRMITLTKKLHIFCKILGKYVVETKFSDYVNVLSMKNFKRTFCNLISVNL